MYANAFSIISKYDHLVSTVNIINPDIIGITESWAAGHISDAELQLDGYDLFRCDRPLPNKGGGVLLYVKQYLHAIAYTWTCDYPEHVWCQIKLASSVSLLIGVCYRTPAVGLYQCNIHEHLRDLIKEASAKHFLLMGDFNYREIDWLHYTYTGNNVEGKLFFDCLEDCMLTQHITGNTTDKSVLDLVITRDPDLVSDVCDLGNFASSDHHLLTWSINANTSTKSADHMVFNYSNMNIDAIRYELQSVDWDKLFTGTADECWKIFKGKLDELRLKHVPIKRLSKQGNKKAVWMTYRSLKYVKKKYKVFTKCKDKNHPAYVSARKKADIALKQAKLNFERKLAANIKRDTKSFFAYVRGRSKVRSKTGPIVDDLGHVVDDSASMANLFNDYFTTVFTTEDTSSMPSATTASALNVELHDVLFTEELVSEKLHLIRDDKAAGPDDLLPRFLATIKKEICKTVCVIFRKSFEESAVPSDWKDANVCPLFKTGSKGKTSNYRPVSLTCQLSKTFESIIRDELVAYLEKNNLIRDSQHGFRHGRSCLSNLLSFLDCVTAIIDSGSSMDAIYLDFAKAFDKVPHRRLLLKLGDHGIRGKLLAWIADWLRNRRQRVCINGALSDWSNVVSGVPQGSVLGPILFLIYINDLDLGVNNLLFKFADDTKLLGKVDDVSDRDRLQADLNMLTNWSKDWLMKFNADKCRVLHFGNGNNKFDYSIEGQLLDNANTVKDLGVEVSADLKSSAQCVRAYNKASRALGMIHRTVSCRNQDIMLSLYKTLVRPHLEYCASAWSPCYKKDKELLERVQHRFTRMITAVKHFGYSDRLSKLNLWSLEERRNRADLIEVFKMFTGLSKTRLTDFFVISNNLKGTRGHSAKLAKVRCTKDVRKHFFSYRVVNRWNALDEQTVAAASVGAFKGRLAKLRKKEMGFFLD